MYCVLTLKPTHELVRKDVNKKSTKNEDGRTSNEKENTGQQRPERPTVINYDLASKHKKIELEGHSAETENSRKQEIT